MCSDANGNPEDCCNTDKNVEKVHQSKITFSLLDRQTIVILIEVDQNYASLKS